jgi:hypothetical protein
MRRLFLLCIFLILGAHAAGAESVITVEVLENGNALWSIEKRLALASQAEIDDWEEYIQKGQDIDQIQKDIAEFRDRIDLFLRSAEKFSNRSMGAEKFNISYDTAKTLSGASSIVRYSFEWKNFSHIANEKIFIGDAFSEGMVLSSDNVLVIKIPDGYEVEKTSPSFDRRDGNRLIWDGALYHSFGRGEPALVLSRTGLGLVTWLLILVVLVVLISGVVAFWKRRRPSKYNADAALTPLPYLTKEDLGDEEMIQQYLIKSGGQAYQSDIVKESGLSKSKISIVLAKMKEDGRIVKIKKGKENIIRLIKNQSEIE